MQASAKQGEALGSSMPQAPVRNGYKFLGWYTEPDGAGTLFNQDTVINGDITVYGFWEVLPPEPPTPPVPPTPENNKPGDLSGLPQTGMKIYGLLGGLTLVGGGLFNLSI